MNNTSFSFLLCPLKAPPGVHHSMVFPRLRNAAQKQPLPSTCWFVFMQRA